MTPFKDISTEHRTQLQRRVQVGRRHETVTVCVPGRDVWAYQMARIELQNAELQARKRLAVAGAGGTSHELRDLEVG